MIILVTSINCHLQAKINVRAIAQGCSEYNVTVVVKREDCIWALRAVHSRLYLSRTTIAMGIIGPGLIGGTLLDQLRDQVYIITLILQSIMHFHIHPISQPEFDQDVQISCIILFWIFEKIYATVVARSIVRSSTFLMIYG